MSSDRRGFHRRLRKATGLLAGARTPIVRRALAPVVRVAPCSPPAPAMAATRPSAAGARWLGAAGARRHADARGFGRIGNACAAPATIVSQQPELRQRDAARIASSAASARCADAAGLQAQADDCRDCSSRGLHLMLMDRPPLKPGSPSPSTSRQDGRRVLGDFSAERAAVIPGPFAEAGIWEEALALKTLPPPLRYAKGSADQAFSNSARRTPASSRSRRLPSGGPPTPSTAVRRNAGMPLAARIRWSMTALLGADVGGRRFDDTFAGWAMGYGNSSVADATAGAARRSARPRRAPEPLDCACSRGPEIARVVDVVEASRSLQLNATQVRTSCGQRAVKPTAAGSRLAFPPVFRLRRGTRRFPRDGAGFAASPRCRATFANRPVCDCGIAARWPPSGPGVDHPVRGLDHVEVVFDHHDRVALVAQLVQHLSRCSMSAKCRPVVGSSRM